MAEKHVFVKLQSKKGSEEHLRAFACVTGQRSFDLVCPEVFAYFFQPGCPSDIIPIAVQL